MYKKKKVSSLVSLVLAVCFLVCGNVNAANSTKQVDGSWLTEQESATGYSQNSLERGVHLMEGQSSVTKTGKGRIYAYASTTANHVVNYVAVVIYVERYNENTGRWASVDSWVAEGEDTYYVSTGKTLNVDGGYYYRVTASHYAGNENPYEETGSFTDGIWID